MKQSYTEATIKLNDFLHYSEYVHAMIGGLLVGGLELSMVIVGQKFIGVWFGSYRPIIPTLILALVLYFTPEGLFKSKSRKTVMDD